MITPPFEVPYHHLASTALDNLWTKYEVLSFTHFKKNGSQNVRVTFWWNHFQPSFTWPQGQCQNEPSSQNKTGGPILMISTSYDVFWQPYDEH